MSTESEIVWKEITFEEKELFQKYYEKEQSRSCELNFTNNYLWAPFYHTRYAIINDQLVFRYNMEKLTLSFPIGRENTKECLEIIFQYFEEQGEEICLGMVNAEQFERLEALYPGKFEISYNRDWADYVYESEKLISLAGKKLHGKRNHINNFLKNYPDFIYEKIDETNKNECMKLAKKWRSQAGHSEEFLGNEEEEESRDDELQVTLKSLEELDRLGLLGGLIRVNGEVIAFSIGEPLSKDTFVVHIEKAYGDIQGAYPMINKQFVMHEAAEYRYINREEDTGAENLRKAKLSYYPAFLQEKGFVRKVK